MPHPLQRLLPHCLQPRLQHHRSGLSLTLGLAMAPLLGMATAIAQPTSTAPIDPKLREQVLQILRENPEVILETLLNYQQQQQTVQTQSQQKALAELQRNPRAHIGQSPTKGARNGQIVLIEFSDFQCPYCARAQSPIADFLQKNPNITLVYKHFPLSSHPQALPAAKASWAANQQGKFWPFHDAIFASQRQLSDGLYTEIAKKLGLDLQRFERDRNSSAAQQAIQQDMRLAQQLGIEGTPFFVMNGQPFYGGKLQDFEQALQKLPKP